MTRSGHAGSSGVWDGGLVTKRGMAGVVIAAAVLVGCGADSGSGSQATPTTAASATKTIFGGIIVESSRSVERVGNVCYTTGGYSDIKIGTSVTVKDAAGVIVGVSQLEPGGIPGAGQCRFAFYLRRVPIIDIYQIEVAHRGAIPYKRADLEARDWIVEFTLG